MLSSATSEEENRFITSICDFLEKKSDNEEYQIALKALQESSSYDEAHKGKVNLFELFQGSTSTKRTMDQFLDFPLNLQFETVFNF